MHASTSTVWVTSATSTLAPLLCCPAQASPSHCRDCESGIVRQREGFNFQSRVNDLNRVCDEISLAPYTVSRYGTIRVDVLGSPFLWWNLHSDTVTCYPQPATCYMHAHRVAIQSHTGMNDDEKVATAAVPAPSLTNYEIWWTERATTRALQPKANKKWRRWTNLLLLLSNTRNSLNKLNNSWYGYIVSYLWYVLWWWYGSWSHRDHG